MRPKVEEWDHGFRTLAKISKWYPQLAYAGLGVLLQIEWQYLQRTAPGVGSLMGPIEYSLRKAFFPALFGGEEVSSDLREILGHSVKPVGLDIPNPWLLVECVLKTSKAASELLVGSFLGGIDLNYAAHKGCVRRASSGGRKHRDFWRRRC